MGVMTGRADGAKGVFGLLFHHHVHRFDGCASGMAGGGKRVVAKVSVFFNFHRAIAGDLVFQAVQILAGVHAR